MECQKWTTANFTFLFKVCSNILAFKLCSVSRAWPELCHIDTVWLEGFLGWDVAREASTPILLIQEWKESLKITI